MDREADAEEGRRKRRVQRHSPDRLVRKPVALPGGVTVSAERHKGRLVVRVESPDEERFRLGPRLTMRETPDDEPIEARGSLTAPLSSGRA